MDIKSSIVGVVIGASVAIPAYAFTRVATEPPAPTPSVAVQYDGWVAYREAFTDGCLADHEATYQGVVTRKVAGVNGWASVYAAPGMVHAWSEPSGLC